MYSVHCRGAFLVHVYVVSSVFVYTTTRGPSRAPPIPIQSLHRSTKSNYTSRLWAPFPWNHRLPTPRTSNSRERHRLVPLSKFQSTTLLPRELRKSRLPIPNRVRGPTSQSPLLRTLPKPSVQQSRLCLGWVFIRLRALLEYLYFPRYLPFLASMSSSFLPSFSSTSPTTFSEPPPRVPIL